MKIILKSHLKLNRSLEAWLRPLKMPRESLTRSAASLIIIASKMPRSRREIASRQWT